MFKKSKAPNLKARAVRPKHEVLKSALMALCLMVVAVAATSPIASGAKPPTNVVLEALTPSTAEAQSIGAGSISSAPIGGSTAQVAPAPTGSPAPKPTGTPTSKKK